MKFEGSIIIQKPQALVAQLFEDPANLKHYQEGFLRKELISGTSQKDGAISKMYYKYGKGEMEMTETILSNRLPDAFSAFYHHKHMDNTMDCRFVAINDQTTRFEYTFDYVRISWFMPRLMFMLFPGMFRKQGEKWMLQFKAFVEQQ